MPNFIQYISAHCQTHPLRLLVSGADQKVSHLISQQLIHAAFARGSPLFVLDNTQTFSDFPITLDGYQAINATRDGVCLCPDLLTPDSLTQISRLRSLLAELGFSSSQAMKVVTYLQFVRETEWRLGNPVPLTTDLLEEYGATMLVKHKLSQLEALGKISSKTYQYLLGRYAEVSAAAADFELALTLLGPFISGRCPERTTAILLPLREFRGDKPMQNLLCKLLCSHLRENPEASVFILDDSSCDRSWLTDFLADLPSAADTHLFSRDIFSLSDNARAAVLNQFQVRIYARHEDMESCRQIESQCGHIDVVKRSTSVSVDRRLRTTSPWDLLFGTNRTDTECFNAPVREPRFRKEMIHSLPSGSSIVDYGGEKLLFNFNQLQRR